MNEGRTSAHPVLEPLDYELTPESAASSLNPNQRAVYELIWSAGIATAMDGPALRREELEICLTRPNVDQDSSQALMLLATQLRCVEDGWGALLPSEIPRSVTKGVGPCAVFPKMLTETLDECSSAKLDKRGCRSRSAEQCESVAQLLGSSHEWSAEIAEISPYGLAFDQIIELMSEQGVGRPSTYAVRLMAAINNDLLRLESDRLIVGEYGKQVLSSLSSLPPVAATNASFSADLEGALGIIESDHSVAGRVLQQFCERSLNSTTPLADWLDDLVIDGESLDESIARAEATLPTASSWDLFALPEWLSPEKLARLPDVAIELRSRLDSILSASDRASWKKLSARQRAAIRFVSYMTGNQGYIVKDPLAIASRDLVLRWWIDLSPYDTPISNKEIDAAKSMIGELDVDALSEIKSLVIQINQSL